MTKIGVTFGLTLITVLFAFRSSSTRIIEFHYPDRPNTTITMTASSFKDFAKEWRGTDYYYTSENHDGIKCIMLFHKLNDAEKQTQVNSFKESIGLPEIGPFYPFVYFTRNLGNNSYEKHLTDWGNPSNDFMFRQFDNVEFEAIKMNQKHMYAFCMVDTDIFVKIHLSQTPYTPGDSTEMRRILNSLFINSNKEY